MMRIPSSLHYQGDTMKLPADATLRSLKPLLSDPDAYVSRAFGVMHRISKDHGDIQMRLGVTGTGQFPNYRIEEASTGNPIVPIDGVTHQEWPDHEKFDGVGTWSTATMSKSEVETLLGEIRNFTRKG
jgi:hypothetical protein